MSHPTSEAPTSLQQAVERGHRLSVGEKIAYALGDTASNFFFQAFNIFLLFYYTDVFGLPAAAVGTMFLVTRIFDAVNDPVMGIIADRTKSRWGKFRPYLLWAAVPYGLIGWLMFANPDLSPSGKLIYAYITYTGMMVAYTVINVPYSALMGVMTSSSAERTSLSAYRFVGAFGGGLLVASLTLPLKEFLGGGDEAAGFSRTMALFAVISVAMFLTTFAFTRERVLPPADQKSNLKKDLVALMHNVPWIVLFFAAIFNLCNVAARNASQVYYFKYVVGNESAATLFMTSGGLALVAGAACTKLFTRFMDRRNLLITLMLGNAATLLGFYFVDPTSTVTLYALNILGAFLAGPTPAIVFSMYADCADYGEWKTGRRTTGLVFSASLFATKLGIAVGGAISGWMLSFFGFVPNAEQSETALTGIRVLFSIMPAGFAVLTALSIFFYPITEERIQRIERELAERKQGSAPQPADA
ncbi:MAG: MFS transporter [Verrucomicrobia bacterium]|nr:MAG: MFS transporter [Verrucomicrobiota bacterium]